MEGSAEEVVEEGTEKRMLVETPLRTCPSSTINGEAKFFPGPVEELVADDTVNGASCNDVVDKVCAIVERSAEGSTDEDVDETSNDSKPEGR